MTRIDQAVADPPVPQPVRLRLPVDEYYKMYELGLISSEDFEKSEIIDGELVRKINVPQPVRLRLPVAEYYKMYKLGLISNEDFGKSEIIDGQLVKKMSIGDRHAWIVNFLAKFFNAVVSDSVMVGVQNPLHIGEFDEPEPDFVLSDLTKFDGRRHPRPSETLLVVEVAESSIRIDRNTKLPLYALNGIPEVWIVNIPNRIVEVYKEPEFDLYRSYQFFGVESTVESEVLAGHSLAVRDLME